MVAWLMREMPNAKCQQQVAYICTRPKVYNCIVVAIVRLSCGRHSNDKRIKLHRCKTQTTDNDDERAHSVGLFGAACPGWLAA